MLPKFFCTFFLCCGIIIFLFVTFAIFFSVSKADNGDKIMGEKEKVLRKAKGKSRNWKLFCDLSLENEDLN